MKNINNIFTQNKLFYFSMLGISMLILVILNFFESIIIQWLSISSLFFVATLLMMLMLKKHNNKIISDMNKLKDYLEGISNKEYNSILHIEHFKEYLEISVILKNIVKRLHQKDKKSSKK